VPKKHRTNIIVTTMFGGKNYQAECNCGWLAPMSYRARKFAERDARNHKEGR